jgi:hypothetical protein
LPAVICERLQSGVVRSVVFSNDCGTKHAGVAVCYADSESATGDASDGPLIIDFAPPVAPACERGSVAACGMCGTSARVCRDGSWSDFGECGEEGACQANNTRPCGDGGVETCGGDCRWGACLGQRCDGPAVRACERCGTQARVCGEDGEYDEWGECGAQRACVPGTEEACGTQGTRACGGNCEWGPCGRQECPGAPTEACGMCGTRSRTCDASTGQWSEFGPCSDEGLCMPDATRACGIGGTQVCGGACQWDDACSGQICAGPRAMACGNCGTSTRSCDMTTALWGEWSPCTGQGDCAPDEERGCGRGGTQVCNGMCRWDSACSGQSCLGVPNQRCGNCGEQTRSCDGATGMFGAWSVCSDEGECRANSTRSCGTSGTQECGEECRWRSECSGQSCTGATAQPCERCGLQRRTCDAANGGLSAWGACEDQGECAQGETRSCGSRGTQTCGEECRWLSACTGQVCAEPAERECGNCGRQTSTCDPNTGRAIWSTCSGDGQCAPGETQDCGSAGVQRCGMDCRWEDRCSMQNCPSPRPPAEECGLCGTSSAVCDVETGEWTFPMGCANEGSCARGERRGCGPNSSGTQICDDECAWGGCLITCAEPLMMPCGLCDSGVRRGVCNLSTGRVDYEEGCSLPSGVCTPGARQDCSTSSGTGTLLCTDRCRWSTDCMVTDYSCEQPAGVACGICGTTGACLPGGVRECNNQGDCVPGTMGPECTTSEGRGYLPCSDACVLSQTCRITEFDCAATEGAACEGQCGTWGPCNTSTGAQTCLPREGACVPGSTDAECGGEGQSGYYACSSQCVLSSTCTITSVDCPGDEGAACDGQCGTWGRCNTSNGEQACEPREGACVPGSMDAECGGEGQSGYYACSSQCVLSSTCTITSVACPGNRGDSCDGQCGVLGPCDPSTGEQDCLPRDGACVPGSRDAECGDGGGTGYYACSSQCVLSSTCTITSVECPNEEGESCGDRCGAWGRCNSQTGEQSCNPSASAVCTPGDQDRECTVVIDGGIAGGLRTCGSNCQWGDCGPDRN